MILPLANIFQPLVDLLDSLIKWLHDDVGFSWGVAIVALTFLVRLAVLPLSIRSIKAMRGIQLLAPEAQEIRAKFKDDPQRFQHETMKLYQSHGLNPLTSTLSGCFGFLVQIPFFIAIYSLLRSTTFKGNVSDSGDPSGLFVHSVIATPTGVELIVLMVLFVVTMAATFMYTMSVTPTTNPSQRYMFMLLPLVMVFFIAKAPAGLAVYWIATNVWSLGQQYLVQQLIPAPVPPPPEEVRAAKAPPPPPRKKKRRR